MSLEKFKKDKMLAVGLMSGTSLDGVDLAIVEIDISTRVKLNLLHFYTLPYSKEVKEQISLLFNPKTSRIDMLSTMNMLLGKIYAEAVLIALKKAGIDSRDIDFISSHGQTIYHQPTPLMVDGQKVISTLQIGDIGVIAELTGITTVGDFRTRDMAVGGQGAPLVPFADYVLFRNEGFGTVAVNIGGIANLTIIPKNARENDVIAYDTGPGNMIIDEFVRIYTNNKQEYDKDGAIAAQGKSNKKWLETLLEDSYYKESPPKSTGRELFGKEYAKKLWQQAKRLKISPVDKIATITELTAVSIANEIKKYQKLASIQEVLISGGGRYNKTLMELIQKHLADLKVMGTESYGIDADAKEAMVFALLGHHCLHKKVNNIKTATGAKREVIMGKISW